MNVILTGFMGTGKTTIGRRLARRLGLKFVDVDELVEASAHLPVARIFAERGEAVFRRLEQRCITRVIRNRDQVIATGGGAFADPKNRTRLRATGPVICLTARPQVILARVGRRLEVRPLLAGAANPMTRIRELLAARAKSYAQADVTIDTSDLTMDQVVEELWQRLGPGVCRSWQYFLDHAGELSQRYGGQYVVVVDNRVVAAGKTHLEAYRRAPSRLTERGEAGIYYIPLPEESLTAL